MEITSGPCGSSVQEQERGSGDGAKGGRNEIAVRLPLSSCRALGCTDESRVNKKGKGEKEGREKGRRGLGTSGPSQRDVHGWPNFISGAENRMERQMTEGRAQRDYAGLLFRFWIRKKRKERKPSSVDGKRRAESLREVEAGSRGLGGMHTDSTHIPPRCAAKMIDKYLSAGYPKKRKRGERKDGIETQTREKKWQIDHAERYLRKDVSLEAGASGLRSKRKEAATWCGESKAKDTADGGVIQVGEREAEHTRGGKQVGPQPLMNSLDPSRRGLLPGAAWPAPAIDAQTRTCVYPSTPQAVSPWISSNPTNGLKPLQ
ncbi:hypothetical protein B0H11DRAFT_1916867 [Mycena galericulata]|nr:hypothetical protein B0H11DRAFT_1916867 [Mycena galericulata]